MVPLALCTAPGTHAPHSWGHWLGLAKGNQLPAVHPPPCHAKAPNSQWGDSWMGFHPEVSWDQCCPSLLALYPCPSVPLSAKLQPGGTSQLRRPAREWVPGWGGGQVVAAGDHVTAGGCVCVSQGRAGRGLVPWLYLRSCHMTSLGAPTCWRLEREWEGRGK